MYRIEAEVLRSGQPRAYADSECVGRITITYQISYGPKKGEWEPCSHWDKAWQTDALTLPDQPIRDLLRQCHVGFTDTPPADWASTRLDYLKQISTGVWEFRTVSPYTD